MNTLQLQKQNRHIRPVAATINSKLPQLFCGQNFIHSLCGMWKEKLWKKKKAKFFPHTLLKTFEFSNTVLWIKKRCGCNTNDSFPHKFSLMLPLLP